MEHQLTYTLAIGDRTYSSWSLRGWLMFAAFDIPVTLRQARMYTPEFTALMAEFGGGATVPALRFDDVLVWDSLAMAETLAERHPARGLWPSDPARRGLARAMVAEMHAGFSALRGACVMNLRHCYEGFQPSDAVRANLVRIESLWDMAGGDGWLFGDYSLADVFFAPVATRIATYGLPVGPRAAAYVQRALALPAFRHWRALGLAENFVQPGYDLDLPTRAWPKILSDR